MGLSRERLNVIDNINLNVYSNVNYRFLDVEALEMSTMQAEFPRAVKAAPEPLGWYLWPSFVNHRGIADAVAGHSELRHLIVERNRDAVLDPRTQELATTGGFNKRMSELPWAMDRPHGPDDFADVPSRRIVESIARHVVEKGYTAVLAPTSVFWRRRSARRQTRRYSPSPCRSMGNGTWRSE